MTVLSTTVRATHLLTNAAWFGGSLMGAVALDPARQEGTSLEGGEMADPGWSRWGPVQGAAIGLHLLSGVAILADNRRRVIAHPPTSTAVVLKTVLTGVAIAAGLAASRCRAELADAQHGAKEDAVAGRKAASLAARMEWLQWATPATTAGIVVLDAYLGEQQRGVAGLLDRPISLRHRS